jgi:phosphoribosylaminoimidazolecarboxamide formyltransferase/IMP cyclohydrolase
MSERANNEHDEHISFRKGEEIMQAVISVYDKKDVAMLGHGLVELGVTLYSTGGTRRVLVEAGVPVRPVSELTGFPEMLEGRVKTLHPAIHAGILARRDVPVDMAELSQHGLEPIDLVVVNLYPFEDTVSRPGITLASALEQIDIGGPTLLRAAAKNFLAVVPVCDPGDYGPLLEALRRLGGADEALRRRLATKAFCHTALYDTIVAAYLGAEDTGWPTEMTLGLRQMQELRYGENPHQRAAFYPMVMPGREPTGLVAARQQQGKPLSYNNILDADAAWAVVSDFRPPTAAIIKHTNPCGLACAADPLTAYELALASDPLAAFGGIVAVNVPVDEALAQRIVARFYEVLLAPDFTTEALAVLATRPNLRVLALPLAPERGLEWRSVAGGMLAQEADRLNEDEVRQGRVVTRRAPAAEEWVALDFAWRAVKHVKSNAIVLAQGQAIVGMGAGQPSRVAAVEIAVRRAGEQAAGTVLASDAFFPHPDGVEMAADAGVRAIVQPGGSIADEKVIAAADESDMAMVLTGARHFRH